MSTVQRLDSCYDDGLSINFGWTSQAQLAFEVDSNGVKLSKEPESCSPGHKSLSLWTADVPEGGICIVSQFASVKQQIAIKISLSGLNTEEDYRPQAVRLS
ncbi:hypothetical protein KIN20_025414 [Parelaphostrongylus tenuis]|uniref:Uncharacterized protein n=1 Tax=Parelaphostrongylus tenuis TaxID=148309 RepID=A0AAD5MV76_PARTN|nr:hypothetical protein KIN20_025414 [Parelaphostrongylus tenuis]